MQKIIFENEKGQRVEFKNSRPFILTDIEGVGGVETSLITTKSPYQDGTTHHNTLLNERILVIKGGIMGLDKEDMFKKRQELSSIFSPKMEGRLTYKNDALERSIDCVIELGPTWGNRVRRMQEFMIQLYCPNPFWQDIYESKEEIAYWVGDFEFPLEIPIETGIEMGHRESTLIVNVFNKGDVECGMRIEFKALGTVVSPSIFDINTRKYIRVKRNLQAGDKLIINTSFGNKRVEMIRSNGIRENVFHYIDLDSEFLQLTPGDNLLRYDAEEGIDNLEVSIYYKPLYLGV